MRLVTVSLLCYYISIWYGYYFLGLGILIGGWDVLLSASLSLSVFAMMEELSVDRVVNHKPGRELTGFSWEWERELVLRVSLQVD